MKFDVRPIPSAIETGFTSRYMEAKVLEDIKLLNEITENYSLGYLSESCAITMLNILNQSEYKLMEAAMEADVALNGMSLEETLNVSVHNIEFAGEGVLPYKEIVKANDGESIYNKYTFERSWDGSDYVYELASKIADKKETELNLYKESFGTKGFTEFERELYKVYPDNRVDPNFLYERVLESNILSGAISLEEGFILKEFVDSRFLVNEDVNSMMPIIPLTGNEIGTDLSNTSTKDLVSATDSEASDNDDDPTDPDDEMILYGTIKVEESVGNQLRNSGAFIALEGVVYKNNIVFDSEIRKLFDKLKKDLKLSNPNDDQASFKALINVKKNRYTFNFMSDSVEPGDVTTAIVSCGFKPIKENGIIVKYEKITKGIKISVEFTSVDNGVIAFYESDATVVKESSLDEKIEFGMDCDASDVKDAAKKVKKLRDDKNTSKEDMEKAINYLDHAIENYKEVEKLQKEKDVKESAKDLLTKIREIRVSHDLYIEWVKESCVDHLAFDHPLFCVSREVAEATKFDSLNKLSEILVKESTDEFVTERKINMVNTINEDHPFEVSERHIDEYFVDILSNSPSKNLYESCYDMLERVYDYDITTKDFTESVKFFNKILELQKENESICETVLNNIEFVEENFNESVEEADSEIRSTIELLNRLGYKVKYSSAGHSKTRIKEDTHRDGVYHGKLYTTARITFDGNFNLKSIPEGWYENKNSDKTAIYVRAYTYDPKDGTPNEAFEKWKTQYIKALKDWAENLSEAKDNNPEAKTESVINDFENELKQFNESAIIESPELDFDDFMDAELNDIHSI